MRLFTAIDIPIGVKEALRALLDRLRPLARLQWSPVENLHITTKFIGEWPEARLEEVKCALTGVTARGPIDIAIRCLGWFPDDRRPRVFWAGVEGGEPLRNLARATEQAVATLGIAEESRAYSPHLTLARIREHISIAPLVAALPTGYIQAGQPEFGSFRATSFFLYRSAAGKYTKLAEFPL